MQEVQLRRVCLEDSNSLFEWRNHQDIRRFSNNKKIISPAEHDNWIIAALENPKIIFLIGEDVNTNPIGVVRFDLNDDFAEISIYIVPGRGGSGLGTLLLSASVKWIKEHLNINKIFANVMNENHASVRMFQKIGFANYSNRLVFHINNS